ncbi:hypothetical protein Lalb_Chr06g0176261 [Lupinus albus]|uniref:Uncharacterized protein n=1 Tax=Lupinus albus TaxID=3870 RepID=A0A6A4QFT6_LUPAL|nr:hypothetical protein Lalb_Chr06g0176261 [Lupinus albus]
MVINHNKVVIQSCIISGISALLLPIVKQPKLAELFVMAITKKEYKHYNPITHSMLC